MWYKIVNPFLLWKHSNYKKRKCCKYRWTENLKAHSLSPKIDTQKYSLPKVRSHNTPVSTQSSQGGVTQHTCQYTIFPRWKHTTHLSVHSLPKVGSHNTPVSTQSSQGGNIQHTCQYPVFLRWGHTTHLSVHSFPKVGVTQHTCQYTVFPRWKHTTHLSVHSLPKVVDTQHPCQHTVLPSLGSHNTPVST